MIVPKIFASSCTGRANKKKAVLVSFPFVFFMGTKIFSEAKVANKFVRSPFVPSCIPVVSAVPPVRTVRAYRSPPFVSVVGQFFFNNITINFGSQGATRTSTPPNL